MPPIRILMLTFCAVLLLAGTYLSANGVWGASKTTVSVRDGTYIGGASRVK